jgi:hypothetical protein
MPEFVNLKLYNHAIGVLQHLEGCLPKEDVETRPDEEIQYCGAENLLLHDDSALPSTC